MTVLALDTALERCQAAVIRGDDLRVLGSSGAPAAGDCEAIVHHADTALAAAGAAFADLSRIIVTVGPGSFTGVRVGIAYAKGLGFALALAPIGVSTLAVMARQIDAPCVVCVDARHGAVYAAHFPTPRMPAAFLKRMTVTEALSAADDAGAILAGTPAAIAALGRGQTVEALDPGAIADAADGADAFVPPRALYLAAADAAPQRHKALARA